MELYERIRNLRLQRGMSLKDVAQAAGISDSMLSQIEHNQSNPSVGTLKKLADVLGVSVGSLFEDSTSEHCRVVRKGHRKFLMPASSGIRYELLVPDLRGNLEFIFVHFEPGASTGEPFAHHGEEAGVMQSGSIELTLGSDVFVLNAGDSIRLDPSVPHSFRNTTKEVSTAIWVITPPSF